MLNVSVKPGIQDLFGLTIYERGLRIMRGASLLIKCM